jgi:AAA domain
MSLFKPAENTMAYFKAGFMGEAGSGKTHTATVVAIGLVQHLKATGVAGADKPVFMLDTENGSSWVKPMFDEAGIPLLVARTRAFKDLVPAVREAEKMASVLFIDSITHFWEEIQSSYMARMSEVRKRSVTRLEFQDWGFLKGEWRKFSDAFVTSNLHCILSGRLGHEYETTEDDRGRKQIEKSGVKMQAEKGLGYEPNILVWMERNLDLSTKATARTATILKDRSRRLDGKQFDNPTFVTFRPHIDFMALGGTHEAVDVKRNSVDTIPDTDGGPISDIKSIRRGIVVEEVQALMVEHHPSQSAEDKKAKAALLEKHFGTKSWTEVERLMPLVDLQANYDAMHRALTGKPSRYGTPDATPTGGDDTIPHLEPDTAPPPADMPDALLDFQAEIQEAVSIAQIEACRKRYANQYAKGDDALKGTMDLLVGSAKGRVKASLAAA